MIFKPLPLSEPLSKYIERIFYHKGYMPAHSIEKVVPSGNVFIIFEFDGFIRKTYDHNLQPNGYYTKVWVSGMHNSHINISAHRNSEMLVVQFQSEGTYPFFKMEAISFSNLVIPAEKLFGKTILEIRKEVTNQETINGKLKVVEQWLLDIFDKKLEPPNEIFRIVLTLKEHPFSSHKELIENYSKTQKHLIHQFKKYCGLTPKELHRIFRFSRVLATIQQKQKIQWTEIVYETGFSDQSHFIKEFQEFSGFNPSEYIKNGYDKSMPNFFPLDREG